MKTLPSIHIHFILHYITHLLLQCDEHIQITINHSTINVETKKINKMKTLPSIYIDFILHYITLTAYYNAKNTFRSQVITVK